MRLGTLLFILLIILVLAVLLGAGGYSVRRYWSPAGSEVVEMTETGAGAGAGIAAAVPALLVPLLRFFGFAPSHPFVQPPARPATPACPKERKEPLNDARHVRNAVARFDQVEGVSDKERDAAWRRIRTAARKFGVEIEAKGWRSLMKGGKTGRSRARR